MYIIDYVARQSASARPDSPVSYGDFSCGSDFENLGREIPHRDDGRSAEVVLPSEYLYFVAAILTVVSDAAQVTSTLIPSVERC